MDDYVRRENRATCWLLSGLLGIGLLVGSCVARSDCLGAARVYATIKRSQQPYSLLSGRLETKVGETNIVIRSRGAFDNCGINPVDEDYQLKHNDLWVKRNGVEKFISWEGWFVRGLVSQNNNAYIVTEDNKGNYHRNDFNIGNWTLYQSRPCSRDDGDRCGLKR